MPAPTEVFITNLPQRVVGGFKPARGVGKGWVAVDYATETVRGTGLATGHDSRAPELELKLGLRGEWILYLGISTAGNLQVWLDGDQGVREIACGHGAGRFMEARLHRANLTGRTLHIAPIPIERYSIQQGDIFLGYIRAVKVDHAPRRSARNLVATNDGFSWIAFDGMESINDVTKQFEPYRDSDFFRMLWCPAGADVTGNHLSRIGNHIPFDVTHAFHRCDKAFSLASGKILRSGKDILKAAVAAARDVGMEFHFYIRPEGFFAPFPFDKYFTSKFLVANPQWRCRDEFGNEVMRMSYAYREVQDHMLAYIEELLKYNPDGICFAFTRSLPMMICEPPVIDAYRAQYGRAPRLPEEADSEKMLGVRQQILTGFLERLHQVLRRRKMVFSCIVDGDTATNRKWGLDIEGLLQRGLVEAIYPGYAVESADWKRIQRKYRTKIYSSLPYTEGPIKYDHQWQAKAFKSILQAGFAGSFHWDAEVMHKNPYNWHVYRHGGSRKFLDRVIANHPKTGVTFRVQTEVRGTRLDRYNPLRSY